MSVATGALFVQSATDIINCEIRNLQNASYMGESEADQLPFQSILIIDWQMVYLR